jgi:hypothetical protein
MVRPLFDDLPLVAALPPLALLVVLLPAPGHSSELPDPPEPSGSVLRWVAEDPPAQPSPQVVAVPVPAALKTLPDPTAVAPQHVNPVPEAPAQPPPVPIQPSAPVASGLAWTAEDDPPPSMAIHPEPESHSFQSHPTEDLPEVVTAETKAPLADHLPVVPIASMPSWPASSGLVWVLDDEPTPLVAADADVDFQTVQTHPSEGVPELVTAETKAPLADHLPVVPIASMPSRPASSGLVWGPDAEPTPLVAADPELDSQTAQTPPTEELRPVVPIALGLRWQVDHEFTALVAANPEASPEALLAAAAPRIISVEMVVEQLQSASRNPTFGPKDLATRLVDATSPPFLNTEPAVAKVAKDEDFDGVGKKVVTSVVSHNHHNAIANVRTGQILDEAILPSLHKLGSRGAPEDINVSAPTPRVIASRPGAGDSWHSPSVQQLPMAWDRSQDDRSEHFSLQPLLLCDCAHPHGLVEKDSQFNELIAVQTEHVNQDRSPARRISRPIGIGIGLQLLSW